MLNNASSSKLNPNLPDEYCFKFKCSDNDWKKVFNDIVLVYLHETCIFHDNLEDEDGRTVCFEGLTVF